MNGKDILEARLEELLAELGGLEHQKKSFSDFIDINTPLPRDKGNVDLESFANQWGLSVMLMSWATDKRGMTIPAKKLKRNNKWQKILTKYNELSQGMVELAQEEIEILEKEIETLENRIANKDSNLVGQWKPIKVEEGQDLAPSGSDFASPLYRGEVLNGTSVSQKEVEMETTKDVYQLLRMLRKSVRVSKDRLVFDPHPGLAPILKKRGIKVSSTGRPVVPMLNGQGNIVDEGGMQGVDLLALLGNSRHGKGLVSEAGYINCSPHEALMGASLTGNAWGFPIANKYVKPSWWLYAMAEYADGKYQENSIRTHAHEYLGCWSAMRTGRIRFGKKEMKVRPVMVDLSLPVEELMANLTKAKVWFDEAKLRHWRGKGEFAIDGSMLVGDNVPALLGTDEKYPFQMRAVHALSHDEASLLSSFNRTLEEKTRGKMAEVAKEEHEELKKFIEAGYDEEEIALKRFQGEQRVAKILNDYVAILSNEIDKRIEQGKLRFDAANLFKGVAACFEGMIDRNVLLFDLNCAKGRAMKGPQGIKKRVQEHGFVELPDMFFGIMQDYGQGSMKLSWQAVLYMLQEYNSMYPMDGVIKNGFDFVNRVVDEFEKGVYGQDFSKLMEVFATPSGDITETEEEVEVETFDTKKLIALWNFKLTRNEVIKTLRDFMRRNSFLFITDGMKEQGLVMPRKRYGFDTGAINPSVDIDGTTVVPVIFNDKDDFESHFGSIFRYPVASKECHGPAFYARAEEVGCEWYPYGFAMHPGATKDILGGDTDGDTYGGAPLNLLQEGDRLVWEAISKDSYPKHSTVTSNRVHVESILGDVKTAPQKMRVGVADAITGQAKSEIGSVALLSAMALRWELYLETHEKVNVLDDKLWKEQFDKLSKRRFPTDSREVVERCNQKHRQRAAQALVKGLMYSIAKWHWPLMEGTIQGVKKDCSLQMQEILVNISRDVQRAFMYKTSDENENGLQIEMRQSFSTGLEYVLEQGRSAYAYFAKYFRTWLLGLGMVNEEGKQFSWTLQDLRMGDMAKVDNPNLIAASLWDDRLWGIMEPTMDDALGKWRGIYSQHTDRLRNRLREWTRRLDKEEYTKDKYVITHWNRSHVRASRAYLFPKFVDVSSKQEEREHNDAVLGRGIHLLGEYLRVANVKRGLACTVKPSVSFVPAGTKPVFEQWRNGHFRGMVNVAVETKSVPATLFVYMVLRHFATTQDGVPSDSLGYKFMKRLWETMRNRGLQTNDDSRWATMDQRASSLCFFAEEQGKGNREDSVFLWTLNQAGLLESFLMLLYQTMTMYLWERVPAWNGNSKTPRMSNEERGARKLETLKRAKAAGFSQEAMDLYGYMGSMTSQTEMNQELYNACGERFITLLPNLAEVNELWAKKLKDLKEVMPAKIWHLAWHAANNNIHLDAKGDKVALLEEVLQASGNGIEHLRNIRQRLDGNLAAHALYNLERMSQMTYDAKLMGLGRDRKNKKFSNGCYAANPWVFLYANDDFKHIIKHPEYRAMLVAESAIVAGCHTTLIKLNGHLVAFVEGNNEAPVIGRSLLVFDRVQVDPDSFRPVSKNQKETKEFQRWNDFGSNAHKINCELTKGEFKVYQGVVYGINEDSHVIQEQDSLEWALFSYGMEVFEKAMAKRGWTYSEETCLWSKVFGDYTATCSLVPNETKELERFGVYTGHTVLWDLKLTPEDDKEEVYESWEDFTDATCEDAFLLDLFAAFNEEEEEEEEEEQEAEVTNECPAFEEDVVEVTRKKRSAIIVDEEFWS